MTFNAWIVLLVCPLLVAVYYWIRLFEDEPAESRWPLFIWLGKGVILPVIVWFGFNSGLVSGLAPLIPEIAVARSSGIAWAAATLSAVAPGWAAIGSFWAALTLGWLAALIVRRTDFRKNFGSLTLFGVVIIGPFAGLVLYFNGLASSGIAATMVLAPVVHCTIPLVQKKKTHPVYSRAVAKLKLGKYSEAEVAVLRELEKSEDDFEGWMMLADLYANQFNDVTEADHTVRELCRQPNITGVQASIALHRLADWHLKLRDDPVAARSALDALCEKLPGSHFAHMAQQRIRQLPSTREELQEQRKSKPIQLPALSDRMDEGNDAPKLEVDEQSAAGLANQCVEKLKRNPNNVSEREKLARILAEQLGKPILAIEQLELLIGMPEQPASKAAEWLGLIGVWQLNYRHDKDAAKKLFERLIREYPQTAQAFAAQRRLNLLDMEQRIERARSVGSVALKA